jgi:RecA-family ATPase
MDAAAPTMQNSDFLAEVYGPLAVDEYGWVCTFRASPEHGDWSGRAYRGTDRQAELIDSASFDNTYFSVSVLAGFAESGKWARQKSTFKRLAALVADDVDPSRVLGYSWALQTSPGKWQVGVMLDASDPDCADMGLVDRVMASLASRGHLGADKSGNAISRYVRLPHGTNTKPRAAGPWRHQLAEWHPSIRWSLADACAAFGIELDDLRAKPSEALRMRNSTDGVISMGSAAGDALSMLSAPLSERSYHDALIRMAASLVAGGMYPGAAVDFLYSLMDQVRPAGPAEEVSRWAARRAEIPRAVRSAEKFAPPDRAAPTVTINLGTGKDEPAEATPSELEPMDWETLAGVIPEPVHFRVAGWLPERTTTLLSANGGVGKSNLGLQLAVALCTGSQWLGMDVTQSRVLVLSAEDEARTVHFRVSNICADVGVDLAVLSGSLTVYDMTQQDCVLWREGVTERMQWLADTVQATRADVVIIDNASDVFASNENDRAEVRGFMRSLNLIAAGLNCAVLLLAHVDKASVRSGAGADTDSTFSGSTAWNNSARSRWAMLREGEAISLRHEKSNFGQRQEEMRLEFDAGAKVFRRFGQIPGAAAARELLRNSHRAAILRLIDTACKAGQKLSMSATANNNAFRVLKAAPDFPRMERSEFFSVLYDLQRDGLLTEEEYTVDRKRHKRLALTDVGLTRVAIGSGAPGLWRA